MRYYQTDSQDANFYFALEEYFLNQEALEDEIFLLWQTRPTLMLGKFQNIYQEIKYDLAKERQTNITRRNTGGGTIYTDLGGFQFTFIVPKKETDESHSDIDLERFMHRVVDGMQRMGIPAELNSRNDLSINGKKFSGNAQCFKERATLHHGSLLYDTDLTALSDLLSPNKQKMLSKGIKSVKDRTTNVKDHCPEAWSCEEFKERFISEIVGGDLERWTLTPEQVEAASKIKTEKFDTWDWIYGRNPAFTLQNQDRWPGGTLIISLEVDKGVIKACYVEGDFFAGSDLPRLEEALKGIPYERAAVKEILDSQFTDNLIHQIDRSMILETIFKGIES